MKLISGNITPAIIWKKFEEVNANDKWKLVPFINYYISEHSQFPNAICYNYDQLKNSFYNISKKGLLNAYIRFFELKNRGYWG